MKKIAIVVLSDPKPGSDESNGRLFNALAAAYDLRQRRQEVKLVFQGTGTRWPAQLVQKDHPFHELFSVVRPAIGGISCACADVFGARADAEKTGLDLLKDNAVPGTGGLASLGALIEEGYEIAVF